MERWLRKAIDNILKEAKVRYEVVGDICNVIIGMNPPIYHKRPLNPGDTFILCVPLKDGFGSHLGTVEIAFYWNGKTIKKSDYKVVEK